MLLGGLTGCAEPASDDSDPSTSVVPTAEPTPTLAPPVAEPEKPAAWSDNGADGAAAAAVWFLSDEYRYVLETNDIAEWQRLSHPDCEFCANVTLDAQQAVVDVERVSRQDGPNRVLVTRVEELNPLAYSVLVDIDQAAIRDYDARGDFVREWEGGPGQILLVLHREGRDWQLREGQGFDQDAEVPSALGADQ